MRTHRTTDGLWRSCQNAACKLRFHLPLPVDEVRVLPFELLLPLFQAVDPPTHIALNGTQSWQLFERYLHREYDLPARVQADGTLEWYHLGKLHRAHGRPAVIRADGSREWYVMDQPHRKHGPAIMLANGRREWHRDGSLHRIGGPAIITERGHRDYYEFGYQVVRA